MKKFIIFLVLAVFGFGLALNAQSGTSSIDKVIKFSKESYDIGKIKFKEKTTFFMEFTNISNKPVVIENVMVGCGCTVAEKPTTPVLPGKTAKIKVGYDGTGAPGSRFNKDVTVKVAGVADPKTVSFSGLINE